MPFDINTFYTIVSNAGGFAKPNRFQVYIPTTAIFQASAFIDAAGGSFMDWINDWYGQDQQASYIEFSAFCERSTLPGYNLQVETNRHYGPSFKIPHMAEYQDLTMTFMCGTQMWERTFFEAWMFLIMDPVSYDFNYKSEYSTYISIVTFPEAASGSSVDIGGALATQSLALSLPTVIAKPTNLENFTTYTLNNNYQSTLIDAFPISISPQEVSYGSTNDIQKIEVTFAYLKAVPFQGVGSTLGAKPADQEQFKQTIQLKSAAPS